MSEFETVEVPFQTVRNRSVLTSMQLSDQNWLQDFVRAFPNCFEYDPHFDLFYYYPDGDAPKDAYGQSRIEK